MVFVLLLYPTIIFSHKLPDGFSFLAVSSLSRGREELPTIPRTVDVPDDLPGSYDARETWKNCSSIGVISDQGQLQHIKADLTSSAFNQS